MNEKHHQELDWQAKQAKNSNFLLRHGAFILASSFVGYYSTQAGLAVYAGLLATNFAYHRLHGDDAVEAREKQEFEDRG